MRNSPRSKDLLRSPDQPTGETVLRPKAFNRVDLFHSRGFQHAAKIHFEARVEMKLSPNFNLLEFIASRIAKEEGIDNRPPDALIPTLRFTAAGMERVRFALGGFPIHINSGYRSPQLNSHPRIGGENDSQHVKGEAIDFICPAFGSPKEIALHLKPLVGLIGVDQLILEGSWIHVSFTMAPRRELLTLSHGRYVLGIV